MADKKRLFGTRRNFWKRLHRLITTIGPWGILVAAIALVLTVVQFWVDYRDRVNERAVRAWTLVTTAAPGNTGKKEALVISANGEDPFFLEPFERGGAVRAAVDEVADGKEAVASGVKRQRRERLFDARKAPGDVAGDEIAPDLVRGMRDDGLLRSKRVVCHSCSRLGNLSQSYRPRALRTEGGTVKIRSCHSRAPRFPGLMSWCSSRSGIDHRLKQRTIEIEKTRSDGETPCHYETCC